VSAERHCVSAGRRSVERLRDVALNWNFLCRTWLLIALKPITIVMFSRCLRTKLCFVVFVLMIYAQHNLSLNTKTKIVKSSITCIRGNPKIAVSCRNGDKNTKTDRRELKVGRPSTTLRELTGKTITMSLQAATPTVVCSNTN